MIRINKQGNAVVIEFADNDKYLFNGKIEIALNELILVTDKSNSITFRRASNGDVLFTQNVNDIRINGESVTKENIIAKFATIGYGNIGGGGAEGAVTSVNGKTGAVVLNANDLGVYSKSDIDGKGFLVAKDIEGKLDTSVYNADKANFATKTDILGFVTNTVDNLTNYYKKSETYDLKLVNDLIGAITTINFKKVTSKPPVGKANLIYLVPNKEQGNSIYDEWIYIDNKWELIGSTKADLSNYYTTELADGRFALQTNVYTIEAANEQFQKAGDYALKSEIPSIAGLATKSELNKKQDTLVSGVNIATINGVSLLDRANVEIKELTPTEVINNLTSDSATAALSAAQGKELKTQLDGKLPKGNYLTEVPKEYITELELNNKDYATNSAIPTTLSLLSGDESHRLVTDAEKTIWNNKLAAGDYITREEVPTKLSELEEDATHRVVTDTEKETWNNKLPKGDYALKSDIASISDLFDATELFTKSLDLGALTPEFREKLDAALLAKKVLYINDTLNNVFTIINFIGKGDTYYSFLAVSADASYSLNLNTNTNVVSLKQAPKGFGFNKYETEYPVSVFELSTESTNNDILRAFSSNDNGVVIPSAGDVFEIKEPGAVSGMVIKDSGIVTSRVETNGKIDLVLISNNLVDDYIVVHTIKLNYNASQGADSLAVDKVTHSVIDPALITQERQATLVTRSELPKMVTLTQLEYDLLPTKDASTYYFIKEA